MADAYIYGAIEFTGGGRSSLDNIDGNDLQENDAAFVIKDGFFYAYRLNASSAASESVPHVISPDVNAGDKRWELQSGNLAYLIDPTESDQGAAGNGRTLKDIANSVGTSKHVEVWFTNVGGATGNTTPYYLDTSLDLSSYTNMHFRFMSGAYLDQVTGDEVLTVPSPQHIIALPVTKIADGNMLAFAAGGTAYPEWLGVDSTSGETAINAIIARLFAAGGGICHLQPKTYTIDGKIIVYEDVILQGVLNNYGGAAHITGTMITLADSSDCDMVQTTLSAATYHNGGIRQVAFDGNSANQASGKGLVDDAKNVVFEDVFVVDCKEEGINESGGFASFTRVHSINNTEENISIGGADCNFTDCEFQNPDIGDSGTYANIYLNGTHNRFLNCRIGSSNSTSTHGVHIQAAAYYNDFTGCEFRFSEEWGIKDEGGATSITGCTFQNNKSGGIQVLANSVSITGGEIRCDSATKATVELGSAGTQVDYINIVGVAELNGYVQCVNVGSHIVIQTDKTNNTLEIDNSNVATSGLGEDTLQAKGIEAKYMGDTSGIRITAAGTISGANDTKTIRLYFGATSVTVISAAAGDETDWRIVADIWNTATNAQRWSWTGVESDGTITSGYDTSAIDTTAAVTLKLSGECANVNDTITQTMWVVESIR